MAKNEPFISLSGKPLKMKPWTQRYLLWALLLAQGLPRLSLAERLSKNPSETNKDEPAQISMIVEAKTREGVFVLEPGEILHSGDELALRVEVDRSAYVYVLSNDPNRKVTYLFPESGHTRLQPGGTYRIPSIPDWIRLDNFVGKEELFVIASVLPQSRAQLLELVQRSRSAVTSHPGPSQRRAPSVRRGSAPPSLLSELQYRSLEDPGVVRGLAIARGTGALLGVDRSAIIQFSFQHQ